MIAWGGGTGGERTAPLANRAGDEVWKNNNPATPNPAYFRHVDRLVKFAAEQNLVLALLPTWGYYVSNCQAITTENARAYGLWLGRRYRNQPNVIWLNGGDRIPIGFEEVYRELGRGLREGSAGAHLIGYHPCGGFSSSTYFHDDDWLDFNTIETWTRWDQVYPMIAADVARHPSKPTSLYWRTAGGAGAT